MIRCLAILTSAAFVWQAAAECHKPGHAATAATQTTAAAKPVATKTCDKDRCGDKHTKVRTAANEDKTDCVKPTATKTVPANCTPEDCSAKTDAKRVAARDCAKECGTNCAKKTDRGNRTARTTGNWHAQTVASLESAELGFDRAIERARGHLDGGRVIGVEFENHDGTPVYEVRLLTGSVIKEVSVDGRDGRIVDVDTQRAVCQASDACQETAFSCLTASLTPMDAKQRALRAMDNFRPVATELTYRGDRQVYAVSLVSDQHWGNVLVDAASGAVIKTARICKDFVDSDCPAMNGQRTARPSSATTCDVKDCPMAS